MAQAKYTVRWKNWITARTINHTQVSVIMEKRIDVYKPKLEFFESSEPNFKTFSFS